jgi:hypothetical protein
MGLKWLVKGEEGQGLMVYGLVILLFIIIFVSAIGVINGDFAEIYQKFTGNPGDAGPHI